MAKPSFRHRPPSKKFVTVAISEAEKRCPHPNKIRFEDKARAKRHIRGMSTAYNRDMLAPYKCRCGVWHIGHKPGSGFKKLKQAGLVDTDGRTVLANRDLRPEQL